MKYGHCYGWMVNKEYNEVTCKQREKCQYYSEDFYKHYGDRLDEFEDMFPFEPCPYFTERVGEVEKKDEKPSFLEITYGK